MQFLRMLPITALILLVAIPAVAEKTTSTKSNLVNDLSTEKTTGSRLDFSVIPEYTQLEQTGTLNLVVVVRNDFTEKLEISDFVLLNPGLILHTVSPLPKDIAQNQVVTGVYTVQIKEKAQYNVIGRLTFRLKGQEQSIISRSELKVQNDKNTGRDIGLVLVGALSSFMGGILTEAVRGWLAKRREIEQQVRKAVGLLLPSVDVCFHAVNNNQDAPISLWSDVYLKEGLHAVLEERAELLGLAGITSTIAELYARLMEYNVNKQIVDRNQLKLDLKKLRENLQKFS